MSAHHHDHAGHQHAPKDFGRAFLIGIGLNTAFVALEVVMGLAAGSLALLSDAGHNLGDVLGLVLAWGATLLARRPAGGRFTFGLKRSTILAALANAIVLLVSVGVLAWEALSRLRHPQPVEAGVVAWVAGLGIVVNGATAWLFLSGRRDDLNVRGAFLHMAADAGVSLGVMVAGLAILWTGALWIDPIVGLIVLVVILWGTWGLFTESLGLALDGAPAHLAMPEIERVLAGVPGVAGVHHVHVWALSTTDTALTAHVVKVGPGLDDSLLAAIREELHEHFGITHVTIQLEQSPEACPGCGSVAGSHSSVG